MGRNSNVGIIEMQVEMGIGNDFDPEENKSRVYVHTDKLPVPGPCGHAPFQKLAGAYP
jgi:hypothetical protein